MQTNSTVLVLVSLQKYLSCSSVTDQLNAKFVQQASTSIDRNQQMGGTGYLYSIEAYGTKDGMFLTRGFVYL